MSAAERREVAVAAALTEFADGGYVGTSTEAIARRVGVSQPYLFRLFPSKKALFIAAWQRGCERIEEAMGRAAEDKEGADALEAMGAAYQNLVTTDMELLRFQLQGWAASCADEDIQRATREWMLRTFRWIKQHTGLPNEEVMRFVATGMMLNVLSATGLSDEAGKWTDALDM